MRILFICKKNETYGFTSYTRRSSGLYNSTRFIVEGLRARGVHAEIIEVVDNNCIDREVTKFKPDVVVIEALWVVPEKFPILKRLHPKVKWFVHMHSGMPFLALEGIAMDWLPRYARKGVGIIANSPESFDAFRVFLDCDEVDYLPNVYIPEFKKPVHVKQNKTHLDVGCFGALRPMKNHLLQALAAIRFAEEKGLLCRFHVNASRIEVGGQPVLKNLVELFHHSKIHTLVKHHWMEPDEFLSLLHSHIDIGLQVSLTETFNVVSADYVTAGIPVVTSKEVPWVSGLSQACDNSVEDIVSKMHRAYDFRSIIRWNQQLLEWTSRNAQSLWFDWVYMLDGRDSCER